MMNPDTVVGWWLLACLVGGAAFGVARSLTGQAWAWLRRRRLSAWQRRRARQVDGLVRCYVDERELRERCARLGEAAPTFTGPRT